MGATELTGANLYATDLTDAWSSTTCPTALTATTKGMCARRSGQAARRESWSSSLPTCTLTPDQVRVVKLQVSLFSASMSSTSGP
jgi:hypothetical protein